MKELFYQFLDKLRSIFGVNKLELVDDGYDTVEEIKEIKPEPKVISKSKTIEVNNIAKTLLSGEKKYRRTPRRDPKKDVLVGKTTFYAWNNGEVYTTTLEGKRVKIYTDPAGEYNYIGVGSIE